MTLYCPFGRGNMSSRGARRGRSVAGMYLGCTSDTQAVAQLTSVGWSNNSIAETCRWQGGLKSQSIATSVAGRFLSVPHLYAVLQMLM